MRPVLVLPLSLLLCALPAQQQPALATRVAYQIHATTVAAAPAIPVDVVMTVEQAPRPTMQVAIPVWAPGSYRLQPFAKKIHDVKAKAAGQELEVTTPNDHTWEVATGAHGDVEVSYRVDLSPTARFMLRGDKRRAITFEGPELYLYVHGKTEAPCTVRFAVPEKWQIATGLEHLSDRTYRAPGYDDLADCPTKLGELQVFGFDALGAHFDVVVDGPGAIEFDSAPWLANIEKIVKAEGAMFGGFPFHRYVFLYTAGEGRTGGGGLEHKNSTCIGISAVELRRNPQAGIGVTAHEFFHLWNVKRLRPKELGPFDYTQPVRSKALWLMEGGTQYYSAVMRARAGLLDEEGFLRTMASEIDRFESNPARTRMSSEDASWRVWDQAARGEGRLDYYNTGAVLCLCLDLKIRGATAGEKSLDDVMRTLFQRCMDSGHGFEEGDVAKVAGEVSGEDLSRFFADHVAGTKPPPYAELLAHAGIAFSIAAAPAAQPAESRPIGSRSTSRAPRVRLQPDSNAGPGAARVRSGILTGR